MESQRADARKQGPHQPSDDLDEKHARGQQDDDANRARLASTDLRAPAKTTCTPLPMTRTSATDKKKFNPCEIKVAKALSRAKKQAGRTTGTLDDDEAREYYARKRGIQQQDDTGIIMNNIPVDMPETSQEPGTRQRR
ncbi:hypothetical protein M408DRAFT_24648 [Serendipita vermifera MAFF 305830]|uniref:Uncharacterized protein n=1 Tax=Serendipita vermifera MAFF 305830 TaxID=933852 RepID=A0A0C3B5G9_SERVB|nr:hypothetical protein M408DRAFT_24648 [Serendipita vermifera MAFF 305830]